MSRASIRSGPTVVVDEARARANIARMANKARAAGVSLRPHVKTHRSPTIAGWLRDEGVEAITVSSVDMAVAFAAHGWSDITVAVPLNPHELPRCEMLAADGVKLGLLADCPSTAAMIVGAGFADLWLKIDCGYGRAGVRWNDAEGLAALVAPVAALSPKRAFGILTHAGQSYGAKGSVEVLRVHRESLERMAEARVAVAALAEREPLVSVGDTPTCSIADAFPGVDEIRPGNFVFYDLMQIDIGSCTEQDIALHVDCPVVGVRADLGHLVLHAGAVHLSKEALVDEQGATFYGMAVNEEGRLDPEQRIISLSQEHGLLKAPPSVLAAAQPGDIVRIAPVHACLVGDGLLGDQGNSGVTGNS